MVNTFITRYPIQDAIADLDNRRLNKQRVEANQILRCLLSAHAIAEIYDLPKCPQGIEVEFDLQREKWYKDTYDWYKHYCFNKKTYLYYTDTEYSLDETPDSKIVKFGFVYHPMTYAWIGYENGLKSYINVCIDEWRARGFKCDLNYYYIEIPDNPDHLYPWWVKSQALQLSHRSALYRKEIARKEVAHYRNIPSIVSIRNTPYYRTGYLWTKHLTLAERIRVKNNEENCHLLCHKILNDFPTD